MKPSSPVLDPVLPKKGGFAAHLQITILVDQNVTRLQITVHDTCRVHVFQTTEDLVQEVLDELLLEWSGSQETVEIGTKKLCHEVAVLSASCTSRRPDMPSEKRCRTPPDDGWGRYTYISSRGDIKISLREII